MTTIVTAPTRLPRATHRARTPPCHLHDNLPTMDPRSDLRLFPAPSSVEALGGEVPVPRDGLARIRETRLPGRPGDQTIAGQAYSLTVLDPGPSGEGPLLEITTAGQAGRRYAEQTARQLLARFPRRMPRLRVRDEPAFPVRGVMIDVSRNRVPTMAELFRFVELLDLLRINHLQLYTEHTFAYAGHEQAWQGWSPMTPDQVRRLDDWCAQHGIELAANQNCFGHLAHWLAMPRYAHLAETHGDWMFDVWPRSGPFSLCPSDPGSIALVEDWLSQLAPCFRSPMVNIGCDETYDLGWGRSRAEVERRGRGTVYLEFVERICAVVRRLGKRPMFWADIALSHPELVPRIPEDLVALVWGYEPDAPFDRWCGLLRQAGREVWVCPGTSSWRSITGRTGERTGNIAAAVRAGRAHGAAGVLICDWGDTGHHQQWPVTAHALAHGADAAWNPDRAEAFDARAASLHVFGDASLRLGPWLERLGAVDAPLRRRCGRLSRPDQPGEFPLRNQSAMFADLHNVGVAERWDVGDPDLWREAFGALEDAWVDMPSGLGPLLADELEHTVNVARLALLRGIARREGRGTIPARLRRDLIDRARAVIEDHRRLWLVRSRPGGLAASCQRYERVLRDLESAPG